MLNSLSRYFAGGVCRSKRRLSGKTVIITGGNTGIGKETAVELAKRGARVIIGCRDAKRGRAACEDIRRRAKRTTDVESVAYRHLDLADFASVRQFVARMRTEERSIDVLVNNAGVYRCPYWRTVDGHEMHFGVNHLGHFLLTLLLMDRLVESKPSRVINVASLGHKRGKIDFNDLNFERDYDRRVAYCRSKLANVLFTRELSRRLGDGSVGVTVNALHPGIVFTNLGRHVIRGFWGVVKAILVAPIALLFLKTPWQGAQTSIYCALAEELDGVSGRYFVDCRQADVADVAKDDEVARRLWEVSEELTGVTLSAHFL